MISSSNKILRRCGVCKYWEPRVLNNIHDKKMCISGVCSNTGCGDLGFWDGICCCIFEPKEKTKYEKGDKTMSNKSCDNTYAVIKGKRVELSAESIKNIVDALDDKEERFYLGQRFKDPSGDEYILASIQEHPVLINLRTGFLVNSYTKHLRFLIDHISCKYTTTLPTSNPKCFGVGVNCGIDYCDLVNANLLVGRLI